MSTKRGVHVHVQHRWSSWVLRSGWVQLPTWPSWLRCLPLTLLATHPSSGVLSVCMCVCVRVTFRTRVSVPQSRLRDTFQLILLRSVRVWLSEPRLKCPTALVCVLLLRETEDRRPLPPPPSPTTSHPPPFWQCDGPWKPFALGVWACVPVPLLAAQSAGDRSGTELDVKRTGQMRRRRRKRKKEKEGVSGRQEGKAVQEPTGNSANPLYERCTGARLLTSDGRLSEIYGQHNGIMS